MRMRFPASRDAEDQHVWCERTGFRIKASELRTEWNGNKVRHQSYNEKHPSDSLVGMLDYRPRSLIVPEAPDIFLNVGDVTADDL